MSQSTVSLPNAVVLAEVFMITKLIMIRKRGEDVECFLNLMTAISAA